MRLFWKIYFWILLLYILAGYAAGFSVLISGGWVSIVDTLISIPSLVGLYFMAYKKSYLSKGIWKFYAVFFPIYEISFNQLIAPYIFAYTPTITERITSALPFLPLYAALIIYAFRDKEK